MNRKGLKLIFAVLLCGIIVTMFVMMISRIISPPEQDTPEPVSAAEPEKPRGFIPDKKNPDDPDELTAFDAEHGLKYCGHITGADSCALWTVSDHCENGSDWSMTMTKVLELPDKFPGMDYVITELGDQTEAIAYSYDTNRICLKTVSLPKQAEIIHANALGCGALPELKQVYLNLSRLKSCTENAFGSISALEDVFDYDEASGSYRYAGTVEGF